MTLRLAPDFTLPLEAVTSTFGLLAVRRAGKSNAAAVLAEELFKAKLPFVVIDPKGGGTPAPVEDRSVMRAFVPGFCTPDRRCKPMPRNSASHKEKRQREPVSRVTRRSPAFRSATRTYTAALTRRPVAAVWPALATCCSSGHFPPGWSYALVVPLAAGSARWKGTQRCPIRS